MALYSLTENCNYGALENEMIRDRLVVGIRDSALSERLQLDAELTLEKAKKAIRQHEAVKEQQSILRGQGSHSVDAVRPWKGKHRDRREVQQRGTGPSNPKRGKEKQIPSSKQCTRCGKEPHPRSQCPAKDATCHKCQRSGHYSAQC